LNRLLADRRTTLADEQKTIGLLHFLGFQAYSKNDQVASNVRQRSAPESVSSTPQNAQRDRKGKLDILFVQHRHKAIAKKGAVHTYFNLYPRQAFCKQAMQAQMNSRAPWESWTFPADDRHQIPARLAKVQNRDNNSGSLSLPVIAHGRSFRGSLKVHKTEHRNLR